MRRWWIGLAAVIAVGVCPFSWQGSMSGCVAGTSYHGWVLYRLDRPEPGNARTFCEQAFRAGRVVLIGLDERPLGGARFLFSLDSVLDKDRKGVVLEGTVRRRLVAFGIPNNSRPVIGIGFGGSGMGYYDSEIAVVAARWME